MRRIYKLVLILMIVHLDASSQELFTDTAADCHANEVKSLFDFFSKGHTNGHIRNYFMSTYNQGRLSDYWTNAFGGAIDYHTAEWKGIQLGVRGIFTYQTFTSDLNKIDPVVGKGAKWEKELYDITRPDEDRDLDRLEELYIVYRFNSSFIKAGKIDINKGPLLLRRDGRMKPFVFRGIWSEFRNNIRNIHVGFIEGVSPRGMTEWYSINKAVGITNNGFTYDGVKANYHRTSKSKGIGVIGIVSEIHNSWTVKAWNYYLHNLSNISWFELDFDNKHFFGGLQFVHQFADPHQASLEIEERYYQPDEKGNVVCLEFGKTLYDQSVKLSGSFLRAFDRGRFLFPKELGRENFFVSQPRSWVDGFGNTSIYQLRCHWTPRSPKLRKLELDVRLQRVDAPSAEDFEMNKYGKHAYQQAVLNLSYQFENILEGLRVNALLIGRTSRDELEMIPQEVFYNTNFSHFNLIANLSF